MSFTPVRVDVDEISSVTVGNSKTVTVPAGHIYRVCWGSLLVTTTATVGNRVPTVQVFNSGNVLMYTDPAASTVPASQTDVQHLIGYGQDLALPVETVLGPGMYLKLLDTGAVDALDTFKVYLVVEDYLLGEV